MEFSEVKYELKEGEEVRIIRDVAIFAAPSKVVFLKEYPNFLLFEGTFEQDKEIYGIRTRKISISKVSLWCGDAKVERLSDGSLIGAKEVEENE